MRAAHLTCADDLEFAGSRLVADSVMTGAEERPVVSVVLRFDENAAGAWSGRPVADS